MVGLLFKGLEEGRRLKSWRWLGGRKCHTLGKFDIQSIDNKSDK